MASWLEKIMGTAFNPLAGVMGMATGNEGDFYSMDPIMGGALGFKSNEDQALEEALKKAQEQQQAYRPFAAQAHMQAADNVTSLFGPVSEALKNMYGQQYGIDTSALSRSPVSPGMLALGGNGSGPLASLTHGGVPAGNQAPGARWPVVGR